MNNTHCAPFRRLALALAFTASLAISACGGSDDSAPLQTLDGAAPLVIAHREKKLHVNVKSMKGITVV